MVLPIYLYDHPILRKKLSLVENINDELVSLIENMHLTMEAAEGIGLASNQVGQDYRFCLLYTSPSPRDRTRSRMPSSA